LDMLIGILTERARLTGDGSGVIDKLTRWAGGTR
jgi:hypothetical protein